MQNIMQNYCCLQGLSVYVPSSEHGWESAIVSDISSLNLLKVFLSNQTVSKPMGKIKAKK